MRLGGGVSLLDPFPERPPRMHRGTYYRLFGKAMIAQERLLALELDWLRQRRPAVMSEQAVGEG